MQTSRKPYRDPHARLRVILKNATWLDLDDACPEYLAHQARRVLSSHRLLGLNPLEEQLLRSFAQANPEKVPVPPYLDEIKIRDILERVTRLDLTGATGDDLARIASFVKLDRLSPAQAAMLKYFVRDYGTQKQEG